MSYDIAIITHPPFFKYLNDLLESIIENKARKIFLLSSNTSKAESKIVHNIVSRYKNIQLEVDQKPVTIAKARMRLAKKSKSDWVIFLDSDIILDKQYFKYFEYIEKEIPKNIVAIAGGININKSSKYGYWEGYADLRVYYNGIIDNKFEYDKKVLNFKKNIQLVKRLKGVETKYLQGYNHCIRRNYLLKNPYDERFWSAEDREMGCKIRSQNKRILLYPMLMAYHNYNFSLKDIIRRKRIHGYWYTKLRNKYPEEYLVPQLTFSLVLQFVKHIIFGHKLYPGFYASIYVRIATIAYLCGIIEAKFNRFKYNYGWKYGN